MFLMLKILQQRHTHPADLKFSLVYAFKTVVKKSENIKTLKFAELSDFVNFLIEEIANLIYSDYFDTQAVSSVLDQTELL